MSHSPSSDGGCPFASFDRENLLQCLHEKAQSVKIVENLQDVKKNDGASAACKVYLKLLIDTNTEESNGSYEAEELTACIQSGHTDCFFSCPSQFYFMSSKFSPKQFDVPC